MKFRSSEAGAILVLLPLLAHAACGQKEPGPASESARSSVPGRVFGEGSFAMVRNSPDGRPTLFEGGSYFRGDEKGRLISPGSVLVVVDKAGIEIGGAKYALGAVLLVVGEANGKFTYRIAGPSDRIVLRQPVTIFGKTHPAGPLALPPGGNLAPK